MLEIKSLYKDQKNICINNLNLTIPKGETFSLECSKETSDSLFKLILGTEKPTSGSICIDEKINDEYLKEGLKHIGVIFEDDRFYERFSVTEYLQFFSQLIDSVFNYKEIMMKLALLDIGDVKINKLNYSQKRRLSFARERLKDLKILIFQEPILNLDKDSAAIVLRNLEELRTMGVTILNTSVSFKDTLLLGGNTYILDDMGLKEIYQDQEVQQETSSKEEKTLYKIEKIPAKVDDRIILFNPMEIDYIESQDGVSNIHVRGEKFISTVSLNDLESRLKYFGFFRCHRSYLVNLQRVREIITWTRNSYSLIIDDKNKSTIPLSKGRMDELKEILKL